MGNHMAVLMDMKIFEMWEELLVDWKVDVREY